jgi:hypothetical protein
MILILCKFSCTISILQYVLLIHDSFFEKNQKILIYIANYVLHPTGVRGGGYYSLQELYKIMRRRARLKK